MAVYEHPTNGYREEVTQASILWAAILGFFYFAYKGAWGYAFVGLLVNCLAGLVGFMVMLLLTSMGAGILVYLAIWLAYAWAAPDVLGQRYLRQGWKRVG